ncbi:MAG: tetratricopeptide repeat protein [bacterium]|nr:tetratricopeptide repeat protein [Candidatus Colisoma equi]
MSKVLMSLLLLGAALSATAADGLSIAREALRDGLWAIARNHAGTNGTEESRLVILESYAGEGKWDEIGKCLAAWKGAAGDGFDYYRAIVRGDHAAAMEILKRGGSSEGLVQAKLYEAEALARDGKADQAHGVWREIVATTNVGIRALAIAGANLMDVEILRRAYVEVKDAALRRTVGLRLGRALLENPKTADEGKVLIRSIVKDAPDAGDSRDAFLAMADNEIASGHWAVAAEIYREAIETWPECAKSASVQENRGWVFDKLGRSDEALEAFRLAGSLAKDDEGRAVALVEEGDVLQELGRAEEAMSRYRGVLEKYPNTRIARDLQSVVRTRELEDRGRALYRELKFAEAERAFAEVGKSNALYRDRMAFFCALCQYGQGQDDEAEKAVRQLAGNCPDGRVRSDATLWLAKFLYNRREWKEAEKFFVAADSLLWAARAAFADGNYNRAIQISTEIAEKRSDMTERMQALMVQGESLIELSRFDEAVLVFDRVLAADDIRQNDRTHAKMLRADALYATGADNPARYAAALEAYRDVLFGGDLSAGEKLLLSYRIARSLDKLKRTEEAMDQYYTQVVLAYREGRLAGGHFNDEVRAAFTKAAFRLADEYVSRGQDRQAIDVLGLVAESDVPAADEAVRRINWMRSKGRFL